MSVTRLLAANVLLLVGGLGLLPLLGVARSWRELVDRSGLAYLCGLVLAGIVAASLALVHVSFGRLALALFAAALGAAGAWKLRGTDRPVWHRPRAVTVAGTAALSAVLAEYARAFVVAPLDRYDAWAIWALKGHALYSFGWADPAVFAGTEYRFANLDYPLWLPSVEAIDFRAMGGFDTRILHLQFLLFLVAALGALGALLRDRVPPALLWCSLLAVTLAPAVFDQLLTAYGDVPLALVFAIGATAAARWLVTAERWALAVATLCFGGALLTKNEGSLFVVAAFLGLVVAARHRRRELAVAAAVDLALLVPWKIYVRAHDIRSINYSLSDSFDLDHLHGRFGIGPIAFRALGRQLIDPLQWGLRVPLFALVLVVVLALGLRALPLYAAILTLVSWLGLTWIYVISHFEYSAYLDSTKERVTASIVLAGAGLTPLLAAEALRRARAGDRSPGPRRLLRRGEAHPAGR